MFDSQTHAPDALVIGAGIGGLATALRLQAAGQRVALFDTHHWAGGKMRAVPSQAGPVDAGPTVLTMRHVFDALFQDTGSRLENHVTLIREPLLARHFWQDGSQLDLTDDPDTNARAVEAFSGKQSRLAFERFNRDAAELFDLFDAPMMQAAEPALPKLAKAALSAPQHLRTLSPLATLARHLERRFSDPKLVQLFGRYATYVGGSPFQSPALLSLIWQAEASGVWRIEGGMHKLAQAVAERFCTLGGTLRLGTTVAEITKDASGVTGILLDDGTPISASLVVFCGDPRALGSGHLGPAASNAAPAANTAPRSMSARVWSFGATVRKDPGLAHHNVFFAQDPREEFDAIRAGLSPQDPTIYVCAEDRGSNAAAPQDGNERFEIILNAAPLTTAKNDAHDEVTACHQLTFPTLSRFGLTFDPPPGSKALTTPAIFEQLFPGTAGSLYGQSPHGMTAALQRPRARTPIPGLYLAGGGTHPGAGVPMAALSGRHAAEAILKDRVST